MDFIFHELLEDNSTASSWNMKSNGKCSPQRKRHDFGEIYLIAFTKGIPIVNHRTTFFGKSNFEKPPEKSGFPIENQKYKVHVYLFSNHSQRLVFTGPTLGRSNFVSGSPAPILSAKSLNRVTLTTALSSLVQCSLPLSLKLLDLSGVKKHN